MPTHIRRAISSGSWASGLTDGRSETRRMACNARSTRGTDSLPGDRVFCPRGGVSQGGPRLTAKKFPPEFDVYNIRNETNCSTP